MKMNIRKFACLTGVSVRTLHYYDEIKLLSPAVIDEKTNYRYYDSTSLQLMKEIQSYREMGFSLKQIKEIIIISHEEKKKILENQKYLLNERKDTIRKQIELIEQAQKKLDNNLNPKNNSQTSDKASMTALMSVFGRAYYYQTAKKPIFSDTIAKKLMTDDEYKMIAGYILGGIDFFAPEKKGSFKSIGEMLKYLVYTQIAPTPVARSKYCEDSINIALLTGTEQLVILGAGFDSFAFRVSQTTLKYKIFEVDHPVTQESKIKRLHQGGLSIPKNLIFIPVDFSKDNLIKKLMDAGFDRSKKTFFTLLGVSYYLTIEEINNILESLNKLSAEGSTLVFDFADENLFSSHVKRVQNMIAMADAAGEPMKTCFSYELLELLLQKHNFSIYELLTYEDVQNQIFVNQEKDFYAFEHISYVCAVKK